MGSQYTPIYYRKSLVPSIELSTRYLLAHSTHHSLTYLFVTQLFAPAHRGELVLTCYLQIELELELIQTQMTQKPMLRAEVGMRVRCANKASAECIMRG